MDVKSRLGFGTAASDAPIQRPWPRSFGNGGMVAAAHPLAIVAGLDALRRGGNAMDAAIAAALTTCVTLPSKSGLGGDAFFLYYDAAKGRVTAVNGSGSAPKAVSRDYFVSRGFEKMPFNGPHSIGVPVAVGAYFAAIERWCRLPVADLFSHAIEHAERGVALSDAVASAIASSRTELEKYPTSAAVFFPGGRCLQPGDRFVQRDLARSLRLVAAHGPEIFYQGELAERIVAGIREFGGEMTLADFAEYEVDVYEPISTTYRGYTVYETSLPTQGHIVLEGLNILSNADLAALGHNTPDTLHLMIEAKKRAFADRNAYSRDPRFGPVPLATLISPEFAAERFASIDMAHAADREIPGTLPESDGDTTYLCTADGDGNMVSFIHSLSAGFGSKVVAGDTGIALNNRAGRGFSLVEGHPNVIEGGKRTMHTLNAYMVAEDDEVILVGGTPGGDRQPQWNLQVLTNLIDFGMDVQSAVDAPRWVSTPGTDPHGLPSPYLVRIESRVDESTVTALRDRGHRVELFGPYAGGGAAYLIARDPATGRLQGGADPRSEGGAFGF